MGKEIHFVIQTHNFKHIASCAEPMVINEQIEKFFVTSFVALDFLFQSVAVCTKHAI